MRASDLLMFAGLAAFALIGWPINASWGRRARLVSAVVACASGIVSVVLLHWQAIPGLILAVLLLLTSSRGGKRWIAGSVLAATIACATPYYLYPLFVMPQPSGPYPVGVRDFEVTRPAVTAIGIEGTARNLLVRVWYPAAATVGFTPRRYFTRDEAMLFLPNFRILHLYDVLTHGYVGAPVRADGPRFPVVIFNHGYLLYPGANTALMEELASHGYVVFSLSHPPDSASYRAFDGTLVEQHLWTPSDELIESLKQLVGAPTYEARYRGFEPFTRAIAHDRLTYSLENWRADDLFLTGALSSGSPPAAVADIAGRVDMERLAYGGMSFGGGVSASTCQVDPHCRAVFSLDGVTWDVSMFDSDLRAPLLLLQSDWLTNPLFPYEPRDSSVNPQDLAFERWAHAGERPDIYRYRVLESAHMGMTDLTLTARAPVRASKYGAIDGRRAIAALNAFTLAFLNASVRGEKGDFPVQVEAKFPEVVPRRATGVGDWWRSRPAGLASQNCRPPLLR
jgi:predicted dienelactone hydrolase